MAGAGLWRLCGTAADLFLHACLHHEGTGSSTIKSVLSETGPDGGLPHSPLA